jgi:hypothetical protein
MFSYFHVIRSFVYQGAFKLSEQKKLMKFCGANSPVSWLGLTDISGTISVPVIRVWCDIGSSPCYLYTQSIACDWNRVRRCPPLA